MKKKCALLILLILAVGLFGWTPGAKAQTGTIVRVDPAFTTVDPNESFSVDVIVENVEDLWAFDVTVTYDPDYLSVSSVEWGDFLTAGLTIPGILIDTPDPGTVQCGMSQLTPALAQTGAGILFTINFSAKEFDSETSITLTTPELVDRINYQLIPNSLQNGTIQIGQGKTEFMNYLPLVIR